MQEQTINLDELEETKAIPGDIEKATIAYSPTGNVAHFGRWYQNAPVLYGFENNQDAYYFIVATTGIDPLAGIPDHLKLWTHNPRPELPEGAVEVQPARAFKVKKGKATLTKKADPVTPEPAIAPYAQFTLTLEVQP